MIVRVSHDSYRDELLNIYIYDLSRVIHDPLLFKSIATRAIMVGPIVHIHRWSLKSRQYHQWLMTVLFRQRAHPTDCVIGFLVDS